MGLRELDALHTEIESWFKPFTQSRDILISKVVSHKYYTNRSSVGELVNLKGSVVCTGWTQNVLLPIVLHIDDS